MRNDAYELNYEIYHDRNVYGITIIREAREGTSTMEVSLRYNPNKT